MVSSAINIREKIFSSILGYSREEILNPTELILPRISNLQLNQEIGEVIREFKIQSFSEDGSKVNYRKIKESNLYIHFKHSILPRLHSLDIAKFSDRSDAIAFWINIYNVLIIHAVIEYGVKNSLGEGGYFNLLKFFRKAAYKIGPYRYNLEDIEHGILRNNKGNPFQFSPQFSSNDPRLKFAIDPMDPRIHFALNCGSISCPPIKYYSGNSIHQQLELATRNFLNQETRISGKKLETSRILQWYIGDFGGKSEVIKLFQKYLPDGKRKTLLESKEGRMSYSFSSYNWGLNRIS